MAFLFLPDKNVAILFPQNPLKRPSDDTPNASFCHSERSEESHGFRHHTVEVLRLAPQNDVVGWPLGGGFCLEIPFKLKKVEVRKGAEFTLDLEILHGSSRGPITQIEVGSYKEVHVVRC